MRKTRSDRFFLIGLVVSVCWIMLSNCSSSLKSTNLLAGVTANLELQTKDNMILLPATTETIAPSSVMRKETPTPFSKASTSVGLIFNVGQIEALASFVGTDGNIIKQLNLNCNFSAFPGVDFVYCLRPLPDGTGMELARVDFDGNVLESHEALPARKDLFASGFNYSVSPDGTWVTFLRGDNSYDPRYSENLDLWLVNMTDQEAQPVLLTKNHRSTIEPVAWKVGEAAVVYADRDVQGIAQLFEMKVETFEQRQITQFDETFRSHWIYQAKISPDDKRVAFTTIADRGLGVAGVIELKNNQLTWLESPEGLYQPAKDALWWNRSGDQLALLYWSPLAGYQDKPRIVWADGLTGKMLHTFPEEGQAAIEHIIPFDGIDVIGFWGYDAAINGAQYWRFEFRKNVLEKIELPETELIPYQAVQIMWP